MTDSVRARRMLSRSGRVALAAALLAGALAWLPVGTAGSVPSAAHAFAAYDTGRVSVVLASAHPSVTLVQDANPSVSAVLSATEVVELTPSGTGYSVLAVAAPTLATSFNGSRPSGSIAPWALSLAAALPVRASSGALWNGSGTSSGPTAGATFGIAELRVDFAPGPSTDSGTSLLVGWTVSNWPLSDPNDILGVVFTMNAANTTTLQSCQASSALAAPACSGSSLSSGQVRWNGGTVGVEADGASGALASVGWSPSDTNGSAAPAISGARIAPTGGFDVVVANPSGAAASAGVVSFSLYAPTQLPTSPAAVVVGSGPIYLIAASLAAGGALGGLALYRDRDERLSREL